MGSTTVGRLIHFFEEVWGVASGVLRLDPEAYRHTLAAPNGLQLALFILILSSFSYTVGQVVVLFANRVNRRHFLSGLAGAALTLIISAFFWSASIWLAVKILLPVPSSLMQTFLMVAISFAPLLFGFMILAPYLGNIIFYMLRIWVFLAIIVGTTATFQASFWQAVWVSTLGWLTLELITRLPFLHIKHISEWLWRVSTGTEKQMKIGDIVTQFFDETTLSSDHRADS